MKAGLSGFLLSEGLAGALRVSLCLLLLSGFSDAGWGKGKGGAQNRAPEKRKWAAAALGGAAISAACCLIGVPDLYWLAGEAVCIAFCLGRFWRIEKRMGLFFGIFYEIAIALFRFLTAALLGICFDSSAFLERDTLEGQAAAWGLYLILAVFILILSGKKEKTEKEGIRLASLAVLTGFLATLTLSEQRALPIPPDELAMWMILSIILLVCVLVFSMRRQYETERELLRLREEQARLLERDYTALNRAYAVNARLFHDLHNHILLLRGYLSHEKYKEALAYLDELQEPVREMTNRVWTGDETVDYLINSKAAAAAGKQIRFRAEAEFPRNTNIRSADLCAILGNLLDNGLEAAEKAEGDQRFVRLAIRRIHQMLVIKVENGFAEKPKEEGGTLKTTKVEGGIHGFGLESARTAAGKYDGTVNTAWEGGVFRAVATLSFEGIEGKK